MTRPRGKISVSLPVALIEEVDRSVGQKRYRSRSAVVEASLRSWAREQRDAESEEYYRSFTAEERAEALEWAELGYEAFRRTAEREERMRSAPASRRAPRHARGRAR
jgi:Arc/MetJ-type ribon-helix-helix transcriptional regulator